MEFKKIYDEHVAFVWRSLRRLGLSESALNDAVQDVFLVVFRRLPDFVERAKLSTWMFRICMRVAKDHRRRAHVRREVLDDSSFELQADPHDGAETIAERQEDLALFDAALGKLDLDQRAVFILFELENMTGEQVAETLEIPLGTVYSRLRRGRAIFQQAVLQQTARQSHRAQLLGAT
jgi:RNA polymerase sigma-70 factor, ECF subfamily